jgi:hypothetical protein
LHRPIRLSAKIEDVEGESSTSQQLAARTGLVQSRLGSSILSHAPSPGLMHPNTSEPDFSATNRQTSRPPFSHRYSISLPDSLHINPANTTGTPSMHHSTHSPNESFIDLLSPSETEASNPTPFSESVSQRPAKTLSHRHNRRPSTADVPNTLQQPVSNLSRSLSTPSWASLRSRGTSSARHGETSKLPEPVPPTTNTLTAQERANLVKKTRKLKWMFGQPPGPTTVVKTFDDSGYDLTTTSKSGRLKRHHRGGSSVSPLPSEWSTFEGSANIENRRHSVPLSPEDVSFLHKSIPEGVTNATEPHQTSSQMDGEVHQDSPRSFIDLMDEEDHKDSSLVSTLRRDRPYTPSTTSVFEKLSLEERAAERRRQKRDKLARIHRVLGSGVPVNLVIPEAGPSLRSTPSTPPSRVKADTSSVPRGRETAARKDRGFRRRSSSAADTASARLDGLDRLRKSLNRREKAINVRRAQKMEKVNLILLVSLRSADMT